MTVTAFRVQNFMGFEDSGWVELRLITLLFGRNSSGKSALIRALLLLRQSLDSSPDSGALLFVKDDGYDFGDYREIVRDHDVGQDVLFWFKLQMVASEDTPAIHKLALDAIYDLVGHPLDTETSTIQSISTRLIFGVNDLTGTSHLKGFDVFDKDDDVLFHAAYVSKNADGGTLWEFTSDFFDIGVKEDETVDVNVWPETEIVTERGFVPRLSVRQGLLELQELAIYGQNFRRIQRLLESIFSQIASLLVNLDYLGPLRAAPQRFYYVAGQGGGMPEQGKEFVRSLVKANPASLLAINTWLATAGFSYRVDLQPLDERKTLYELRLQEVLDEQKAGVSANIREVGFGLTQMLPIIAQAVLAKPGDTLIIEQPELHLHPRAQAELADLFIAMARNGIRFLIETHSEHLLLRLRRRIAETTLQKFKDSHTSSMQNHSTEPKLEESELGIYFVQRVREVSTIEPLRVDNRGEYVAIPEGFSGFFSSDFEEVLKINLAIAEMNKLDQNHAPDN
jgi:hypothetical protein